MALSEKQKKILAFPYLGYDALICDGAVRSGKTSIMAVSFVRWAMERFQQRNFAICGKTVQSAVRNVITPLLGVRYFEKYGYRLSWSFSNHMLTVSRGNKTNYIYVFGGKDEASASLIQGITLAGVMLDEVALMPRSFVEQALARCSVEGSLFWFNCNPENPNHWFYQEWVLHPEKHNALHLHFLMEDNPALSPAVLKRYQSMYSGIFYERFVLGRWCVTQGLVYPMFAENSDRFLYDKSTDGITGRFFISIDYGTYNPCSMGLWCIRNGTAIRIDESYFDSRKAQHQRTDEEHYDELVRLAQGRYIEAVIIDPSAASFVETIRRHGKFLVRQAENSVIPGINVTAALLAGGKLRIHPRCTDSIREFGMYRWDDKKQEDAVIKEYDHAMDDIRYFAATVLAKEFRWAPWRGGD